MMNLRIGVLLGTFLLLPLVAADPPAEPPPSTQSNPKADARLPNRTERLDARLAKEGVPPTTEGIENWFREHEELLKEVEVLIEDLGSDAYADREMAAAAIDALPGNPRTLLEAAQQNDNPEIRAQAERLLSFLKNRPELHLLPDRTLAAAMAHAIETRRLKGLTDRLLQLAKHHDALHLQQAFSDALAATADPTDRERLETAARNPQLRAPTLAARLAVAPDSVSTDDLDSLPAGGQLLHAMGRTNDGRRDGWQDLARFADSAELPDNFDDLFAEAPPTPAELRNRHLARKLLLKATQRNQPPRNGWSKFLSAKKTLAAPNPPLRIEQESFESFCERVRLYSTGFDHGNSAHIAIDERVIIGDLKSTCPSRRGLNVVAMQDDELLLYGNYDTFESKEESDELAADLNALPPDCFLALAAADEPTNSLTDNTKKALKKWGIDSGPVGYRSSWWAIGQKGLPAGKAIGDSKARGLPSFYPQGIQGALEITKMPIEENRDKPRLLFKKGKLNERPGLAPRR